MENFYYTNSDATICTIDNILCYTLKRALPDDVVQKPYADALAFAKEKDIHNWLVIEQEACNEDSFITFCTRFLPGMVPVNKKVNCVAFVLNTDCFNAVLQSNGNNKAIIHNSIFHVRIFTDTHEATDWLKTVQK